MSAKSQKSILVHLMESSEFSDLKFTCQGQDFKVHKAIVCGLSPVIKALVQGGFNGFNDVVPMGSFQPSTVKQLVQFIYTGDYDDPQDELDDLPANHNAYFENMDETEKGADTLPEKYCQSSDAKEASTDDSSTWSSSTPPPNSADPLFQHILVNSIGNHYQVDELISLANTKIKSLLQSHGEGEDQSWVTRLPSAIEEAVMSTTDEELLEILASATAANVSTLVELDEFKNLRVMSDFSVKVLKGCVKEIEERETTARSLGKTMASIVAKLKKT